MYFERYSEKNQIPKWSTKDGIPAYILPTYEIIGVPVEKTNYFVSGTTGTGKTTGVKKILDFRLQAQDNLRLLVYQVKMHDFDKFFIKNGLFICHNSSTYPDDKLFKWNSMKEFRLAGEKGWFNSIQEFTSCAASEFRKSAGSNLYFVDTAEECVIRFFLALLHTTKENISNDKTWGFLEHEQPEKILDVIANYRGNHSFLKIHFEYDYQEKKKYTLTKRGRDIFIFINKIVRVVTGTFRQRGNDTIWEFMHGGEFNRLCICHEEGNKASYIMEQYFLKRITTMMLGSDNTITDDLLMVLDEVDKSRVTEFPLAKLATLGREVGNKHTQLVLSTQSFESLYAIAENGNEHDTRSMLSGFPCTIAFNPGMDETTRNILQSAYGNHMVQRVTAPLSRYDSPIIEMKEIPWVSDEQFASLDRGQAIVKIQSERPYRVQLKE